MVQYADRMHARTGASSSRGMACGLCTPGSSLLQHRSALKVPVAQAQRHRLSGGLELTDESLYICSEQVQYCAGSPVSASPERSSLNNKLFVAAAAAASFPLLHSEEVQVAADGERSSQSASASVWIRQGELGCCRALEVRLRAQTNLSACRSCRHRHQPGAQSSP